MRSFYWLLGAAFLGCGEGFATAADADGGIDGGSDVCGPGKVWCPGCFGGGACYAGGCPGAACPPPDARTDDGSTVDARDAGPTNTIVCIADAGATGVVDPQLRSIVRGSNGEFQDSCDAAGNLIEYSCEVRNICSQPPNPDCQRVLTGLVVSQSIDCNGHCMAGTCVSRCPQSGDQLVYKVVDPAAGATFENQADHRVYVRTGLGFDNPNDGYDCKAATVGQTVIVVGIGMTGSFCTGGTFGNIAIGPTPNNETCAYIDCRFGN